MQYSMRMFILFFLVSFGMESLYAKSLGIIKIWPSEWMHERKSLVSFDILSGMHEQNTILPATIVTLTMERPAQLNREEKKMSAVWMCVFVCVGAILTRALFLLVFQLRQQKSNANGFTWNDDKLNKSTLGNYVGSFCVNDDESHEMPFILCECLQYIWIKQNLSSYGWRKWWFTSN